jgi:hypothetical protein
MSVGSKLKETLDNLQGYAADYFETIYKTTFEFWTLPNIPSGANILNGAFAIALISLARAQMSQSNEAAILGKIVVTVLFFILLVCGILIIFDRNLAADPSTPDGPTRITHWRKLVSVVSVGVTLGCAFIVLDAFFPWINAVFSAVSYFEWSSQAANRSVATVSSLCACTVILTNTIFRTSVANYLGNREALIWTTVIFFIVIVAINVLITTSTLF